MCTEIVLYSKCLFALQSVILLMCIHDKLVYTNAPVWLYLYITCDPHQPAGVMKGLQPAVKWGQEGASASHNLLEKTVIAVLTDIITTHSAFVSFVVVKSFKFWT